MRTPHPSSGANPQGLRNLSISFVEDQSLQLPGTGRRSLTAYRFNNLPHVKAMLVLMAMHGMHSVRLTKAVQLYGKPEVKEPFSCFLDTQSWRVPCDIWDARPRFPDARWNDKVN
jgi:hypothetical protein